MNEDGPAPLTQIVVPCYNEANRIRVPAFDEFMKTHPHVRLLFVDDGSTDATKEILEGFCRGRVCCDLLSLVQNRGKGEAVRAGLNACLQDPSLQFIGYWDADLATPLSAVDDFLTVMDEQPDLVMVAGARVKLMGRNIKRRMKRHYIGRVFATLASLSLGLAVYDTQCGAKLFRVNPKLQHLFKEPFLSRWIFDVEIFARIKKTYMASPEQIIFELPLWQWEDVAGSKLKTSDFWKAARDLLTIWRTY